MVLAAQASQQLYFLRIRAHSEIRARINEPPAVDRCYLFTYDTGSFIFTVLVSIDQSSRYCSKYVRNP